MNSRRYFIAFSSLSLITVTTARATMIPEIDPRDPQAAALGYVNMASNVDKAKYPKYTSGQSCGTCRLYRGNATNSQGQCSLLAGRPVSAKGWCSAYTKS